MMRYGDKTRDSRNIIGTPLAIQPLQLRPPNSADDCHCEPWDKSEGTLIIGGQCTFIGTSPRCDATSFMASTVSNSKSRVRKVNSQ